MERINIGIDGFNTISNGGLPKVKTTLVTGTSGSGKTVFAAQFIAAGIIQKDDHGVFITFEERPSDIRTNIASLGWNVEKWEEEKKWAFVDASSVIGEESIIAGDYNFSALLARIEHAVKKVNARRLSMDSLGSVFSQFSDANIVRKELFNISAALKQMGVTSIITTERSEEYGEIARFGIEEFVIDNVIILRNVLENEKRRRTMEILKFRGTHHQKGEFPFTIIKGIGIVTIPLSGIELKQRSSNIRISSGNTVLNNMCGGGFFQNSIILVSGATGCGKTLLATEFAAEGGKNNERSLVVAYEESRDQIYRNAAGWGIDFEK
jgi:circadian clock protein KaiC